MTKARRSPSDRGLGVVVAGYALVRVRGTSMEPTLRDGNLLVVRAGARTAAGDLVVVRLPGREGLAVKRAVRLDADGWWVERDNPRAGVDSWAVGAIAGDDVVARVLTRLWPPRRIQPSRRL
jgi:hypothetical protein